MYGLSIAMLVCTFCFLGVYIVKQSICHHINYNMKRCVANSVFVLASIEQEIAEL